MENLDLKEVIQILWDKKVQLLLITLIFIIIGLIYSLGFIVPKYEATTKLLLATNSLAEKAEIKEDTITTKDFILNSELVPTYRELIKSNKVIRKVVANLGFDIDENKIRNNVNVTAVTDTQLINVTVRNEDAVIATKVSNEIAKVFIETIKELYKMENIHIVDNAEIATNPSNINHIKNIIIFAFMGIIFGTIYVFLSNMLDTRMKSERDVEKLVDIPVSTTIPLQFICCNKGVKTLLITSTNQGEGKSRIASNLATIFAQTGKKVVLIDADIIKGELHKSFNIKQRMGLSDYLTGTKENSEEDINKYLRKTDTQNLSLIPSGEISGNSSELLLKSQMENLLENLKKDYDLIIIDGTSAKIVPDSIILSAKVDSTLLVVGHKTTKKEDFQKVVKDIKNVGGNIIGAVYNQKGL